MVYYFRPIIIMRVDHWNLLWSKVVQYCCGCNGRVVPCQVQPVPYQDARQFQHADHYDVHNVECLTVQIIVETEMN